MKRRMQEMLLLAHYQMMNTTMLLTLLEQLMDCMFQNQILGFKEHSKSEKTM